MAKRRFDLPGIQDLSKEQEAARALPKAGQHLIVGGPGTGKSVLALIRTRRHQRDGDDYLFLVYNHLLNRASGQLFGEGLKSETWIGWFQRMFWKATGKPAPLLPPRSNGAFRAIDWDGVETILQSLPDSTHAIDRPYLVIDEGQDMPLQFYESLVNLGFENFFVTADQNQQITDDNSSRQDIENGLGVNTPDVKELTWNYRNRYPVARLAREFYTGDPASPPPDLPSPGPSVGTVPRLCSYHPDHLDTVGRRILRLWDRDPRQLIGVIAPNNRVRERYLEALQSADVSLDNSRPTIETFHGDHRPDVVFGEGGILLINAQACKGLEFDTVILADIDEHLFNPRDPDAAKRLFYVMVARAKERVFLFMKKCEHPIEKILPTDRSILQREEL
ncbi:MAG: ATP-binding domain-containing protein [Deltaproteobacteria bacterium]|nr:ATP-binding domain-containing protein [Deltaproteobacteria bacterium]